jgi:para-nitrobenzyl esterase
LEIPFVFDNVDSVQMSGSKQDRFALAKQMSGAWAAFARTGKPDFGGVTWRPYTPDQRATMMFDAPSKIENDPEKAERLSLR